MSKNKRLFGILALLFSIGSLSACATEYNTDQIVDPNELITSAPRELFTNSFTTDNIPDYWPSYGVGDPFVYRFNGMYYLICSTKGQMTGIMGWKSPDLINWEPVQAEGLPRGYVTTEDSTFVAFAPEMTYFNGWFYLLESRRGNGHYILRSRNPEGPFTDFVDNFGESIDGSFFIDDDEQIYMLRASNAGCRLNLLDDDFIIQANKQLSDTEIGNWTEGPNLIKHNGIYYLEYTGTAVTSAGYRVAYSYHDEKDGTFFDRYAFNYGKIILLNTSEEYNGLGHAAYVMGPNLDSQYLVYHNLVALTGPYRHFNLARVMFNGTEMSLSHPELNNNLVPEMPDFYSREGEGMETGNSHTLSDQSAEATYTAEFNLVGDGRMVFDYQDENNYCAIENNDDLITVTRHTASGEQALASIQLNKQYDYSYNHTYRIKCSGNKFELLFDNMRKISTDVERAFTGGKIGYETDADFAYTAFSNDAFDSSQNNEYKQDIVPSNSFDLEKSSIDEDALVSLDKSEYGNGFQGGGALALKSKGNRAAYKLYVEESGYHGIDITVPITSMGKKIGIRLDNKEILTLTVPTIETEEDIVRFRLTGFAMDSGVHFITAYYAGEPIAYTNLHIYKSTDSKVTFSHDLSSFIDKGVYYVNSWKIKYGGHYALSGNRQMLYLGSDTMTDYSVEVDITLDGATQASTAGVLLRGKNVAFSKNDDYTSVQGFYCGFNNSKIFIMECNYNQTISNCDLAMSFESQTPYHLKATCIGNIINLYIDDELTLTYSTSIGETHGAAAFYTNGAAAIYQNVNIALL